MSRRSSGAGRSATAIWPISGVRTIISRFWATIIRAIDAQLVTEAIDAAPPVKQEWGQMPWDARAIVFLKAAELLAGKYRHNGQCRYYAQHEHDYPPS